MAKYGSEPWDAITAGGTALRFREWFWREKTRGKRCARSERIAVLAKDKGRFEKTVLVVRGRKSEITTVNMKGKTSVDVF